MIGEMVRIDNFSVQPLRPSDISKVMLVQDGKPCGMVLSGALLEAQYRTNAGDLLLFLSNDCPFEEELHVYLLSADFQVLDHEQLGWAYTPGAFRNAEIVEECRIRFAFLGDHDRWELTILPRPRWTFSFKTFFRKRQFHLQRVSR